MKKRHFNSRLLFYFLLVFGSVVLLIGTFRGENSLSSYFQLKKTKKVLEQTVKNLEDESRELSDEISKIKKSPSYAKKVLKDKYHITEEDERIIFLGD